MLANQSNGNSLISKNLPILDNSLMVETPEGISLEFRLAGPVVRSAAWLIDLLIRVVIYGVLVNILKLLGDFGFGLLLIGFFFTTWFYAIIFELIQGATPGKRAMGLIVVHSNGTPIGWQASVIRNLLRAIDFLPIAYGVGLTTMLLNENFQRLGDITADTVVIYRPDEILSHDLPDRQPKRPPPGLTQDQCQAIVSFAERKSALTDGRAVELANRLSSLTGKAGEQGVDELLGYAYWLVKGDA